MHTPICKTLCKSAIAALLFHSHSRFQFTTFFQFNLFYYFFSVIAVEHSGKVQW